MCIYIIIIHVHVHVHSHNKYMYHKTARDTEIILIEPQTKNRFFTKLDEYKTLWGEPS